MALTDKLTAIADAIRAKTKTYNQLTLDQMATAISELSTDEDYIRFIGRLVSNPRVPDGVVLIGAGAFYKYQTATIDSLPSTVKYIDNNAFAFCTGIKSMTFPAGLVRIDYSAFQYCTNLATVTFEGTPEELANNTFSNCEKLTTINVPWGEGEVANAPWGAINATINYNYTGET